MFIDFLSTVFERHKDQDAVVWQEEVFRYDWLIDRIRYWREKIKSESIKPGTVTVVEADYSPNSIALFLALVDCGCILVPLTKSIQAKKSEFIQIAQGEVCFSINQNDQVTIAQLPNSADHYLYQRLRYFNQPGLVLFSSGSTGESKAAVHNLLGILDKFKTPRHALRAITFLLYDHIGGVNTMLYTLSNGGCIVTVRDRNPDHVLSAIEAYRVQLLPTSPTFINLLLLSEAYKRHNIDSLRTITYGTEPMPESTLKRLHDLFPNIKLLQTYGLSEVGILRSKSKGSDSLWVKVGGNGFQTRVVDNVLQIKAKSAMLGYLNAPSPFTVDGWFNTGDIVEKNGDYIKILGRRSEIINVGGEKVYPAEVESVIQEIENVAEVTVYGEKNPILGCIVCAKVSLSEDENAKELIMRVKRHCSKRLQNYKVPIKVAVVNERQYSDRFKKVRNM